MVLVFAHDAPTGPGEYDTFCCACQACSPLVRSNARQLEVLPAS